MDVFRIKLLQLRGAYESERIEQIVREDFLTVGAQLRPIGTPRAANEQVRSQVAAK
jgi:hypothetical protein